MRPIKKRKIFLAKLIDGIGKLLFLSLPPLDKTPLDSSKIQSILVLELYNIGDVIMALPALHALRELFPMAKISFLGGPWSKDILENNPDINEILLITVPWVSKSGSWKQTWQMANKLKERKFDLAIDLRGDFRNIVFLYLTKAKERLASASTGGGFLLTRIVPNNTTAVHDIDQKLNVIKSLGDISSKPQFHFSPSPEEIAHAKEEFRLDGILETDIVIGIHPGGRWYGRRWRPERFAEVINSLGKNENIKFVVFGGPEDQQILNDIVRLSYPRVIQIYATLKSLPGYLSQCDLFLCNESGPMHYAAAVGIPVIALFGPNTPDLHGPYGENHTVLMAPDVPCRPCDQTVCIMPHRWCMDLITAEEVIHTIENKVRQLQKENP